MVKDLVGPNNSNSAAITEALMTGTGLAPSSAVLRNTAGRSKGVSIDELKTRGAGIEKKMVYISESGSLVLYGACGPLVPMWSFFSRAVQGLEAP
jgi:hypothetical protein